MGASHRFDLTADVTHLLIGEIKTPKYKYVARERPDVAVLNPEWVEAVRQSWMQGGDTDIRALEEQWRLPTFTGLSICATGFEDGAFRDYLRSMSVRNGAEYSSDLTKDITHLVARDTQTQKYKFATQWNVIVVTRQWFTDSLERGMILDEALYHPLLPPEQQGAGAWNRAVPLARETAPDRNPPSNPRPRKLRRTASAKLVGQNEGIWGDIVGAGFESSDLRRSRGSQHRSDSTRTLPRTASIVQEARSFASESGPAEPRDSRQSKPGRQSSGSVAENEGFLHGCYFFIHGFSSKQGNVLRHHLSFNGAQLVGSLGEFSRPEIPKRGHGLYIIVPYTTPRTKVPSTEDLAFECEVVTDMWLERCLDAKALVLPESHVANTPLLRSPVPGFHGMKICSTGFSKIDLLHLSKLATLAGGTYHEYLTSNASVLICNDAGPVNPDKLRHTSEWGVAAVSVNWLWDSIRSEQKRPFEPYAIKGPSRPPTQNTRDLEVRAGSRTAYPEPTSQTGLTNIPLAKSTASKNIHVDQSHGRGRAKGGAHSPTEQHKPTPSPKRPAEIQRITTSPSKVKSATDRPMSASPAKRPASAQSTNTSASSSHQKNQQSALEIAMNGILKQAREANSRSSTTTDPTESTDDALHKRRRRPLLGRAPSHSSVRSTAAAITADRPSRASSIDTLNEDGYGSAVDSVATESKLPSLINSGQFNFADSAGDHELHAPPQSQSPPPMTQLDYEDPDAVAMREKFLRGAGKAVEKKTAPDVDRLQELENSGWGAGRRTRATNRVVDDEF
ncbi:subunit of DNA polymerase II [Aspergillus campestris IBT 28561]|uniref:Subunit of DNA polymerase II n=1 Tax=Aspergillus campestris (strain IBT 28561) TaxID=1392248 RepID=A0A2I1D0U8_ASPC2|nr:subunit of DNA polymerase II [Aspergillus campestris IBT 28561]PKY03482.1 subunit of DNA polymerase II [Aspergillus campestris IBT 28561]